MRRGALVVAALVVLGCSGWPSDLTQACWLDDDQCASMAAKEIAADGPLRDEAMEQLDRLCMQDHPAGCYEAGMVRGFGKTPSRARAAVDLHKACEVSYGEACFQEARVLDGSGEGQDYGRAAALYATECDKGSAGSCTNLGYMVERGHGGAVDVPKAATLYGKGCDGGDQVGCVNFGLMLA
ncbi:MAG: sel1 repeat family protein, partial [Myxococcales bacterium]|nr:sel1 repeat family protein [Myxococcales bacterium]